MPRNNDISLEKRELVSVALSMSADAYESDQCTDFIVDLQPIYLHGFRSRCIGSNIAAV